MGIVNMDMCKNKDKDKEKKLVRNHRDHFDLTEKQIIQMMELDTLEIWINSFGGCMSNMLHHYLEDNNCRCVSNGYKFKGCHYLRPLNVDSLKYGIFCYVKDIGIAITSQLNREIYHNYFKLRHVNKNKIFDKEPCVKHWMELIDKQITNWTDPEILKKRNINYPIIIINMDKFAENKDKLDEILHLSGNININLEQRKTKTYHKCMIHHLDMLKKINNKLSQLPDFAVIKI